MPRRPTGSPFVIAVRLDIQGGKTWLIPRVREWLRYTEPDILIELFAGGAIVSLTAVILLSPRHPEVAAVVIEPVGRIPFDRRSFR